MLVKATVPGWVQANIARLLSLLTNIMSGNHVNISLRVHPNAAKNEVVEFSDGVLRVRIAASPVKGKANKELVAFLSKTLGLGRDSLTIIKGHTSHNKVIAVAGLSQEEVVVKLAPKPSSSGDATRTNRLDHQ